MDQHMRQAQIHAAREASAFAESLRQSGSQVSQNASVLAKVLRTVESTLKDESTVRAESIKAQVKWNRDIDHERAAEILMMQDQLAMRRNSLADEEAAAKKHNAQLKKHLKELKDIQQKLENLESQKTTLSDDAYEQERAKLEDAKQSAERKIRAEQKAHDSSIKVQKRYVDQIGTLSQKIINHQDSINDWNFGDVGNKIMEKVGTAYKNAMSRVFDPNNLSNGLKGMLDEARSSMSTGSDYVYANANRLTQLIDMQLSPQEYMDMNTKYRQLILSVGGADQQLQLLKASASTVAGSFATPGDAAKYAQEQMSILAKSGIKPTLDNITLLNSDMQNLRKTAGMTGEQFNEMMTSMIEDQDIQSQMRTMNSTQRIEMIRGLALRAKENNAMGVSIEQTLAMAKSMAALDNQTYKERHAAASRLQMLSGAMGKSDLGNQIATILRKVPAARSKEEQQALQDGLSQLSNEIAQARGSGNVGLEVMFDSLMEGLNFESLLGKGSDFNTNMAESRQIASDGTEAMQLAARVQAEVPSVIKEGSDMLAKLTNVTNSSLAMIGTGVAGILGQLMLGRATANAAKKLGGKILGRGKGGPSGGAGGPKGGGGRSPAPVGGASSAGASAGKGLAEAGGKSQSWWSKMTSNPKLRKAAAGTAKAGKFVGKKVPGVALGIGLWEGGKRAMAGDFTGAGMEIASGAAATLPGMGTAASVGLDAAIIARDIANSKKEAANLALPTPTSITDLKINPSSIVDNKDSQAESNSRSSVKTRELYNDLLEQGEEQKDIISKMIPLSSTGNDTLTRMLNEMIKNNESLLEVIELLSMTEEEKADSKRIDSVMFGGRAYTPYAGIK